LRGAAGRVELDAHAKDRRSEREREPYGLEHLLISRHGDDVALVILVLKLERGATEGEDLGGAA